MEDVGLVDQDRAGRPSDRDLFAEELAQLGPVDADRKVASLVQRHGLGRPIKLSDVRQQDEAGHLRHHPVGPRHDDGVVLVVAVVGLVVVDRARVLRPELDLVAVDVLGLQEALGRIDQVRIDRHLVQGPGRIGEEAQAGELALGELRIGLGVGEIGLRPRVDLPERILSVGQRRLVEETLHDGEAAVEHLRQFLVRYPHRRPLGDGRSVNRRAR